MEFIKSPINKTVENDKSHTTKIFNKRFLITSLIIIVFLAIAFSLSYFDFSQTAESKAIEVKNEMSILNKRIDKLKWHEKRILNEIEILRLQKQLVCINNTIDSIDCPLN